MRVRAARLMVAVMATMAVLASSASATGGSFPPDPSCQTNGVVRSILYLNGVAYLAGDFTQVAPAGVAMGGTGTVTRDALAACSEKTGAILSWNPGANGRAYSLAHIGNTIYVGGSFTTLAGKPRQQHRRGHHSGYCDQLQPGCE